MDFGIAGVAAITVIAYLIEGEGQLDPCDLRMRGSGAWRGRVFHHAGVSGGRRADGCRGRHCIRICRYGNQPGV